MLEQPWRLPALAVVVSVISAAISVYSVQQARRAADAGHRQALAAERLARLAIEQARRVVYSNIKVSSIPDYLFVRVQLRNSGTAPARIAKAVFDIPSGPCATHLEFPKVADQIIDPGEARGSSLCVRRRRKIEGVAIDCATLNPRYFVFSVKYQISGLDDTEYQESNKRPDLRFTDHLGDPTPCPP